ARSRRGLAAQSLSRRTVTEFFDPALEAIAPDDFVHRPWQHCRSLSVRQISKAVVVAEIVGEESERVAHEVLIRHDSQLGTALVFDLLAFGTARLLRRSSMPDPGPSSVARSPYSRRTRRSDRAGPHHF